MREIEGVREREKNTFSLAERKRNVIIIGVGEKSSYMYMPLIDWTSWLYSWSMLRCIL